MNNNWNTLPIARILKTLNTEERGLSEQEAHIRLQKYGGNILPEAKPDSIVLIFFRQFQSPLIYILVAAAVVVFAIGELFDTIVIGSVLCFNAIIGAIQEGKAQNTLRALKRFAESRATILRDGAEVIVPDTEVVPGDILILQEGEKIAADARVFVSNNLTVDEAALTGESEPVVKTNKTQPVRTSQSESNSTMVFKGTHIVAGNGRAIIVATGVSTTIGAIASAIGAIDTESPLKANLRALSKVIMAAAGVISLAVFTLGAIAGRPFKELFLTSVSLVVSIVPEGLPIVVTLVLAMGVWRMGKKNALVKKLQAVESLGQARVLAVDKTGTITKNELTVQQIYAGGNMFDISGSGYDPKGIASIAGEPVIIDNHPDLFLARNIAAFCANATVAYAEKEKQWRVSGDPTEAALLVVSQKLGADKPLLEKQSPLIAEIPFDYKLKYHATLHSDGTQSLLTVVGAPEVVLERSARMRHNGEDIPLTADKRKELSRVFARMSSRALRVIAVAFDSNSTGQLNSDSVKNLTFLGFYGMKDATRPEAASAIQTAASAGIKIVMITGDHAVTAQAIASDVGIWRTGDRILTGTEIDDMTEAQLSRAVAKVSVFARVTPAHKMKIVGAYRSKGIVIGMTGDGVNDAPSLVAADLGVAMGIIGTEVAKEAADIVLLDDNLGSIVSAIEEGRGIYRTIKKVVLYLFSTSLGEALTILAALAASLPLPLLPAQIIWLNLVTDGFLTVALAAEPKEKNLLDGSFEKAKKYFIDRLMSVRMLLMAAVMAAGAMYLFVTNYEQDITKAWTLTLTVLAVFQWFNAWNCRSETESVFRMNPFSNRPLVAAIVAVILLQCAALYVPFMQTVLRTSPLSIADWLLVIPIAVSIVVVEEIRKIVTRIQLTKKRR